MSAFTDLTAEFHAFVAKAEAAGLRVGAELTAAWHKLVGDEQQLAAEAHQDEMQVAQDAAPVVAEAKGDVEQLAEQAVADVKDATTPPVEPPAAPTA